MPGGRWIGDPRLLRRRSYQASFIVILINALASGGLSSDIPSLIYPVTWLLLPVVALGIGYGNAFFIEHGRGVRRAVLTIMAGVTVSLISCVFLAGMQGEASTVGRRVAVTVLSAALYGALLYFLAALIGLGAGRGPSYAAKRIADSDEENW